jgi:hypothetical protein
MKRVVALMLCWSAFACENEPSAKNEPSPGIGGTTFQGDSGVDAGELPGVPLEVLVPGEGSVFVDLAGPSVVELLNDGADHSTAWDLAFSKWDVFTNSGPSGSGAGKAFGPLEILGYFSDTPPEVPFLTEDRTGGAFLDWYDYDGAFHALYSRFHVYGVKRDERLWKVQILGYYGEVEGAPVSAIYSIRYAEVTSSGIGETVVVENIDGTAGGPSGSEDAPSTCLDLATGALSQKTPSNARVETDWDLCFRRTIVSVNGELGGPGPVGAVDLDADKTATETLAENQEKTADSTLAGFEAIDTVTLANPALSYRGDRIVSAFSDVWVSHTEPPTFENGCWRVVGGDGTDEHVLVFTGIDGYGPASAGKVTLRVRSFQ